ncbi:FAD/NAD-P-binding domain-containing protein [Ramaria rubella]|nr:FAD/NAD-P-binding domain-containing protein [Ramaria rubella]
MKVVIIGAGAAGLVTCKTLLQSVTPSFPFDPVVLEQEDDIGVSSKQLTSFSDFRLPLDHPDHLTLEEYVEYLRAYIKHFDIESKINLQCKVIKVSRDPAGGHRVLYVRKLSGRLDWETSPSSIHAQYIVVCTGLHVIPSMPTIPGIQHVLQPIRAETCDASITQPAVFHSTAYKGQEQLRDRRVMILGTGETGMDLAYESAKAGATEVILCTRGGFLSFPKALNDFSLLGIKFTSDRPVPIDSLITNLAETAYVHPWIEKSHLRWFVSDFVIKGVLWVLTGTTFKAGCNQWVGELEKERLGRAYVFLNKSHRAMPYINRPYRKRSTFLDHLSRYIDPPEDSPPQTNFVVDLAPFPTSFLPSGQAVFPKLKRKDAVRMANRDVRPDTVIFATGYTQDFGVLDESYPTANQADIRNVVRKGDEDVAFIGFVRPGVGAIPPIAEMQAMFWISLLKGQVRQPLPPPHYHLLVKETARIKYGVDHSTYMSTLAKDIGAAPGLWELWWTYGTHVLLCYAFGAAFTPFYRLVGPFRSRSSPAIIKTELWETITRRGVLGNLIMGLIPMTFYLTVSAIAYVMESVWILVGARLFGY